MNNEAQTTTEQLLSDARAARGATVGGRPKYNPFATWTEAPWLPATPPDSPEHNQGLHGLLVRFAEEARKMFFDETEPVEFRRALAGVMNALGRLPDYRDMPRAYGWVLVGRFHPGEPAEPIFNEVNLPFALHRLSLAGKTWPGSLKKWQQVIKPFGWELLDREPKPKGARRTDAMTEPQTTTEQLLEKARKMQEASIASETERLSRLGVEISEPRYNPFTNWTKDDWLPATPPDSPEHNRGLHRLLVCFADETRKMFFDETEPVEFRLALAGIMNELGCDADYGLAERSLGPIWEALSEDEPGDKKVGIYPAAYRLRVAGDAYPLSLKRWEGRIDPICDMMEASLAPDK